MTTAFQVRGDLPDPKPISCIEQRHSSYITGSSDFTLYWDMNEPSLRPLLKKAKQVYRKRHGKTSPIPPTIDGSVQVVLLKDIDEGGQAFTLERNQVAAWLGKQPDDRFKIVEPTARACLCSCFSGKHISGTIRTNGTPVPAIIDSPRAFKSATWSNPDQYAIHTADMVSHLFQLVFPSSENAISRPKGLIVFAGATNSSKSLIAQAFTLELANRAVQDRMTGKAWKTRIPHIITFEDPIENWVITRQVDRPNEKKEIDESQHCTISKQPKDASEFGFCFTPREKGVDVPSLAESLFDAKRQTPTCVYVGEVRDRSDWTEIARFAGTGHSIVTTTHASSLSETLARFFEANDADTPAARRFVAANLLACVHLSLKEVKCHDGQTRKILFPSIWLNQGPSLNSLVADGLSSITPDGNNVLGRRQFLECGHFGLTEEILDVATDIDLFDLSPGGSQTQKKELPVTA